MSTDSNFSFAVRMLGCGKVMRLAAFPTLPVGRIVSEIGSVGLSVAANNVVGLNRVFVQ